MKKKKSGPIIGLLLTLLFFGVFIYWLITPSAEQELVEKIKLSTSIEEIKSLYLPAKSEFTETGADGNLVTSEYLQDAVREKLTSMKLNENEIQECLKWIPPKRMNLNLIVVPDWSNRLKTFPDQAERDLEILQCVFETFKKRVSSKQDSRDLLMIEVTDPAQANGEFSKYANDLRIDLGSHQGKSNRLFFIPELESRYNNSLKEIYRKVLALYSVDKPKTKSADYWSFFGNNCSGMNNKIKKDDFYNGYSNKILILSDGLMDGYRGQDFKVYTKMHYDSEGMKFCNRFLSASKSEILEIIEEVGAKIPHHTEVDLSDTKIMLCETRSQPAAFDALTQLNVIEVYWSDWLHGMHLPRENFKFYKHEDSSTETIRNIEEFVLFD